MNFSPYLLILHLIPRINMYQKKFEFKKKKKLFFSSLYLFSPFSKFYPIHLFSLIASVLNFLHKIHPISSLLLPLLHFISSSPHLERKIENLKAFVITVLCFFNLVLFIIHFPSLLMQLCP